MRMNHHPAPGMGDLVPGMFIVPQNPIQAAMAQSANTDMLRVPGVGELLPAKWTLPENPLRNALQGGGCGCGCKGSGSCGGRGKGVDKAALASRFGQPGYITAQGLGDLGFMEMFQGGVDVAGFQVPKAALWAAGAVVVIAFLGGGRGRQKSEYQKELAALRKKYPTRAGRVRRSLGAAAAAY